jgi:hypothetical protein
VLTSADQLLGLLHERAPKKVVAELGVEDQRRRACRSDVVEDARMLVTFATQ